MSVLTGWRLRAAATTALATGISTVALLGASVVPAQAATFTVNSTADAVDAAPGNGVCATASSACTLRAAVMEANALAGADTITLPAGTYTLTLGPADNDGTSTASVDDSGDLDVEHDLTINGAGAGSTTINGGGIDRIFDVGYADDGTTAGADGDSLTITNLTLTGGNAAENDNPPDYTQGNSEPFGGAIRFDGFNETNNADTGVLTLTNVTVTGNTAEHAGGAIFQRFGSMAISGSTFSNNLANAGDGGAIYWGTSHPGNVTISNSTFTGNRALEGIPFDGDFGHIATGGDGGALAVFNGNHVTITNSAFSNNQAEHNGGAIDSTNHVFSLTGSTLTGNKAGKDGGALYSDPDVSVSAGAVATVQNSTFQSNIADATVTGAAAGANGTGDGGAIHHFGGKLVLKDSTIGGAGVGNSAVNGGGLAFDIDVPDAVAATSEIRENQFLANSASAAGGGIYSAGDGTLTAQYNRIRGNTAPTGKGLRHASGTLAATRNWWGCNTDPAAGGPGCDTVSGGVVTPFLKLTHTASPGTILVTEATTLTASFLKDSAGGAVALADITPLIGLPITFGNPVLGTLSGAGSSIGAGGTATATYTAGSLGGPGSADATVDSGTATAAIEVHQPPVITVPADITVTEDAVHSHTASVTFQVTSTGYPVPNISCSDGGGQFATGTAPLTVVHDFTEGVTNVTCTASNGVTPDSTDSFTVTVNTSPTLVVPADITVSEDVAHGGTASVTFDVTASGHPQPVGISCSIGTTVIGSGQDSVGITRTFDAGVTTVSCTADNGIDPDETKSFTVSVETLPQITVPADITVVEDTAGGGTAEVAWTTSATGHPTPTIACSVGGSPVTSPHTFALGTTTVECTATNSEGSDVDSFTVTVEPQNALPVVVTGGPYAVAEGSDVGVDGSGSSDPDGDPITFAWDLDNDGTFETSGVSATFSAAALDGPAVKTIGLQVSDDKGGVSTATTTVTVANVAPTATMGGSTAVPEGDTGTVTLSDPVDPGVADTVAGFSYSWDFDNDGTFEVVDSASASATVPAAFLSDGPATRTVRGRISDDDGGFTDYTWDIDVLNVAPTATLGNNGPVAEGGSATVTFTDGTDPSPGDAADLRYSWDIDNDGTLDIVDSSSPTTSVPVGDGPGVLTVRGRISDDDGGFTDYVTMIDITNVAPTATLGNGGPYAEGSAGTVTFSDQADAAAADLPGLRYSWDVDNDGTFEIVDATDPSATVPASVLDDGPGSYDVRGRISDKDGGFTDYVTTITVTNVAPTATIGGSTAVPEGSTGTVTLSDPVDPSGADSAGFTYSWDFDNDGTLDVVDSSASSATVPASYLSEGPATRTVRGRISDKDGGFTDYTWDIDVTNVAPTATLGNNGPVAEGSSATVTFTGASDPSAVDAAAGFTYSWDIDNDGTFEIVDSSSPTASVPVGEGPGAHTVRGRISDKDGGFTDYLTTIDITNVAPTATLGNGGPYAEATAGTVTFTDQADASPADLAGLRYSWDLDNDGTLEIVDSTDPSATVPASVLDDGPGSYDVRGRISDDDGGFTDYVTTITVSNVIPSLTLPEQVKANVGVAVAVPFNADDPSPVDDAAGFSYTVDWGDGSAPETVSGPALHAISHTYADVGTYTMTATATDKDGGVSAPDTALVTVGGLQMVTDPCNGSKTTLLISGGSGDDRFLIRPSGNEIRIDVNNMFKGFFSPTARIVVLGNGGDDTVRFDPNLTIAFTAFGGDGNDTILGGNGFGIAVGGAGDDRADLGNSRDLGFAGSGADVFYGWNGEDLLIAGPTVYDAYSPATVKALCAIHGEWARSDESYRTRIDHLTGTQPGGKNGTTFIRGGGPGQTVFNDNSVDVLYGENGQDWFVLNSLPPGVHDSSDGVSGEFRSDVQ